MSPDTLTAEDQARIQFGLSLSSPEKKRAYMDGVRNRWASRGWLNQEDAEGDQAKRFADKMRFPKLNSADAEMNVAMVLENQLMYQRGSERRIPVMQDASGQSFVTLTQDVTTADESLPTREVMPIVRRVYAIVQQNKISRIQPIAAPSSYVFWLDFIRETDNTNILSLEYNQFLTAEMGVPQKGKFKLTSRLISAVKQMLGMSWSSEAEEDAKAVLGLDVESELVKHFYQELVRDLFGRHMNTIYQACNGAYDPSVGASLPGIWQNHLTPVTIPGIGTESRVDYKATIYSYLLNAEAAFLRANRIPADSIMAGYGMAAFLQNLNTATGVSLPDRGDLASVGISNYGNYAGRWSVQGTEFLPDNVAIMFAGNPDPLHAAHVYAPYVPITATPKIYGDYDATTGNFQNKDAWTRNIRERSAETVTKPYGFQLIIGPTPLTQF